MLCLRRVHAYGLAVISLVLLANQRLPAQAVPPQVGYSSSAAPLIYRVTGANQRMEMTVNTSRVLTLDEDVPQVQVNNKDMVDLTPIASNQIQVSAKKTGITQINLWTGKKKENLHTIDVIIFGDAKELEMILKSTYPRSALKIIPTANSVIITGYVDRADHANRIVDIASDYYPKVINSMTVGGVQQVQLFVKVMEVSRTKLRTLGNDFAWFNGQDFVVSSVSGLIASATGGTVTSSGAETFAFGVTGDNSTFLGLIEALRQNDMLKVLAEPKIVTVSGRPAFFNAGGEFPILVPQSLGTVSIEYKKFGTQVDFVPIVLGNGAIRLEVRPRVSEIDNTRSVTINSVTVPGLRVREIDTAAEMRPGQTMAIAGLVQTRTEAQTRGLPWISEVPYLGAPFRRVTDTYNEVELLILITPQLVDAMDANEVPPCGPGMMTDRPSDCELYLNGYIEVPRCGPGQGGPVGGYGPVGGPGGYAPGSYEPGEPVPAEQVVPEGADLPPQPEARRPNVSPQARARRTAPDHGTAPARQAATVRKAAPQPSVKADSIVSPVRTAPRTKATPVSVRSKPENRSNPVQLRLIPAASDPEPEPGFIGPMGYDVIK